MKRTVNGIEPHRESKIVLSKIDKIIFAIGAFLYGITAILEEKFNKRTAVSSSIAITAVGIFLFSRAMQNKRDKKVNFPKEKRIFWLMLLGGSVLGILGFISLIIDIKNLFV